MFHSITACDTTSFFTGRGKITAWKIWRLYPEATSAFLSIANNPTEITPEIFSTIERFIILMYDKGSEDTSIKKCRLNLFAKCNRQIQNIPPTKAALHQHILRSTYQGGFVWGSLEADHVLPSPQLWGWQWTNDSWKPLWTTLPEAVLSLTELMRCACKTKAYKTCKCAKAHLPCTVMYLCGGECKAKQ